MDVRTGREEGFTLIELMVALVVFGIAIAAATSSFIPLVGHFTQQGKIAETQMESEMSLEVLREDVEHAGYGLPVFVRNADWPDLLGYDEAVDEPASKYNDADTSTGVFVAPRAFVLGNNVGDETIATSGGINDSDYLVIRSAMVRKFQDAGRWTYVTWDKDTNEIILHEWLDEGGAHDEARNFSEPNAKLIFMRTVKGDDTRILVANTDDNSFYSLAEPFINDVNNKTANPFYPPDPLVTHVAYAVGSADDVSLRMPFNRADYYISTAGVPRRCAPHTGVLMKAVLQQNRGNGLDGKFSTFMPLFDCVADMQIVFGLDMDENSTIGTYTDGETVWDEGEGKSIAEAQATLDDAELLWKQLREVRIYILAHEGQRDPGFSYTAPLDPPGINVGEFGCGHEFKLTNIGVPEYRYYRWKVYTMILKPENLR